MKANATAKSPQRIKRYVKGKAVSLADLPLVAYSLLCGHNERNYAVQKGDTIFCAPCAGMRRVSKILAQ